MARLRLFAQARESAGTGEAVVEADTVGDVLDVAVERFGPAFAELLATCRVWVNGEAAERGDPVTSADEVAVLPPVSGGSVSRTAELADRYVVVPDVRGPRIRLGLLWTFGLFVSLALSAPGVAVYLAFTAGVAALQSSARWRDSDETANQWLAAGGAFVITVAAAIGNTAWGLAIVLFAVAATLLPAGVAVVVPTSWAQAGEQAWGTLASGLIVAVAAGCAVQLERIDALTFLFLVGAASTYDAGNFLCTEGRRNRWVGPVAGMAGVVVVSIAMAIAEPPPFHSAGALAVGLVLVVLCPAGQLFGSWLLPRARAHAPALRRLDSWLLAGPLLLIAAWIAQ